MSAILDSTSFTAAAGLREPAAAGAGPSEARPALPVLAALLGGLLAGSLAFGLHLARPGPQQPLAAVVGSTALTVPRTLLRMPGEARNGVVPRLDLRLSWPDMAPLAAGAVPMDEALVAIVPADDSPAPETRVATLYARFLEPQVQDGPGDLITRHFKKASPYSGEVLVFSPPDGKRIAARCESGQSRPASLAQDGAVRLDVPATCIAEIRRDGLDIQLRFEPRLAGGLEAARQHLLALVDRLAR